MQNNDGQELHRQALQPSARDDVNPYERAPRCDISQILNRDHNQEDMDCPLPYQIPQDAEYYDQQTLMKNVKYNQVQTYERIGHRDIPFQLICVKPSDHERVQSPSAVKLPLRLQNQQGDKQIYNCVYITTVTHTPNN